jgi:hypothetical protein
MCHETPLSHIHPKDKYTVPLPLQIGQSYTQDLAPQPLFPIQVLEETSEGNEVFNDYNRNLIFLLEFKLRKLTSILRESVLLAEVDQVFCTERITTLRNKM